MYNIGKYKDSYYFFIVSAFNTTNGSVFSSFYKKNK